MDFDRWSKLGIYNYDDDRVLWELLILWGALKDTVATSSMLTLLEEWSVVVCVGDEHEEISGRVMADGESPVTHQHLQGEGSSNGYKYCDNKLLLKYVTCSVLL